MGVEGILSFVIIIAQSDIRDEENLFSWLLKVTLEQLPFEKGTSLAETIVLKAYTFWKELACLENLLI